MGCTNATALVGVTFNCSDIPVGGLKTVYLAHLSDASLTEDALTEEVTNVVIDVTDRVELEFNNKDAFSNFTDVKTVDKTGTVIAVPTISMEFPKMTATKRLELNNLTANAGLEIIAFVRTAADTYHAVGVDYGMFASEVNGQSGEGRSSKNIYQLTLTGEEDRLALNMDETAWGHVVSGNAV